VSWRVEEVFSTETLVETIRRKQATLSKIAIFRRVEAVFRVVDESSKDSAIAMY
jgi:hypothetical protein